MPNYIENLLMSRSLRKSKNQNMDMNEIGDFLLAHASFPIKGESPIDQLGISVQNPGDLMELKQILKDVLEYPSTELASYHKKCNRLGNFDLNESSQQLDKQDINLIMKQALETGQQKDYTICPCCGFKEQLYPIKICTSLQNVKNLGVSMFLYLEMPIYLILLITVLFVVYGIYSLITNIIAALGYNPISDKSALKSNIGILVLSLGSKQLNSSVPQNVDFYYIQCWIGLLLVLFWGVGILLIKLKEAEIINYMKQNKKSVADYSIAIYNIPSGINQEQLQDQLDSFYEQHKYRQEQCNGLKIARLNKAKPFYLDQKQFDDEELKELIEQEKLLREKFVQYIKTRSKGENSSFASSKEERRKDINKFKAIKLDREKKQKQIAEKIISKATTRTEQEVGTTTAFVTFQDTQAKNFILSAQLQTLSQKIGYFLTCCFGEIRFRIKDSLQNQTKAYVEPAPEPEDIIWQNIGYRRTSIIKRKLITFATAIILLGISFAVAYGLSVQKLALADSVYLSYALALLISLFNFIIVQALKYMTYYQKDITVTNIQTSIAIKSIFALMINTIFTPIMVNYFIEDQNLYGIDGLAEDVFYLGITNSFLTVAVNILDPEYYFKKIYAWYSKKPKNKLKINQAQLNQIKEYPEFQIGHQYIYMVSLFLFICFFSSLQPIICLFAIVGLILTYWVQKYRIFHRSQRPIPCGKLINNAMISFIRFGPILFSLGNLTWSNFFPDGKPKYALVPNLISCGIGLIIFIFPYSKLIAKCKKQGPAQNQLYSKNRIFMTAEYDRLNPMTAKQAIKDYQAYIKDYQKVIENQSQQQNKQVVKILAKQLGNYQPTNNYYVPGRNKNYFNKLMNTVNENKHISNTLIVYEKLFPKNPLIHLTVPIQNWITHSQIINNEESPGQLVNLFNYPQNNPQNKQINPFEHLAQHLHQRQNSYGLFPSYGNYGNHGNSGSENNLKNFSIE